MRCDNGNVERRLVDNSVSQIGQICKGRQRKGHLARNHDCLFVELYERRSAKQIFYFHSWLDQIIIWLLFVVASRILALSLLASLRPTWMIAVCSLHWVMMSIWLALGHAHAAMCINRCEELLLSAALGLVYVFAFIANRDGQTRYSYLAYYLVCFMENTGALVIW